MDYEDESKGYWSRPDDAGDFPLNNGNCDLFRTGCKHVDAKNYGPPFDQVSLRSDGGPD